MTRQGRPRQNAFLLYVLNIYTWTPDSRSAEVITLLQVVFKDVVLSPEISIEKLDVEKRFGLGSWRHQHGHLILVLDLDLEEDEDKALDDELDNNNNERVVHYRTRWLLPRLTIDLHWKVLLSLDDHG